MERTSSFRQAAASLSRTVSERRFMIQRATSDLVRSLSGTEKTFKCAICLCFERINEGFAVEECGHMFCYECLSTYTGSQIVDGITDIQCPYIDSEAGTRCTTRLQETQILQLVEEDPDIICKYQRFKAFHVNANNRECPKCGHVQAGDPAAPQMRCNSCGLLYCFAHSNAHAPTESCSDYEARTAQSTATRKLLEQDTKPCPNCGALTHKFTGCNHMTCSQCRQDWCWLCGERIDVSGMFPAHYAAANIASPCAGKQFTDDSNDGDGEGCSCAYCMMCLMVFSPLAVPFWLLAILVFLVNSIATLPWLVSRPEYRRTWFRWVTPLYILLGIYVSIAGAIIIVPCLLVGIPVLIVFLALCLLLCIICPCLFCSCTIE